MNNYTGVWSLSGIIEFIEKYKLSYLFKSRSFKSQCFSLKKKIPFEVYDIIMGLDGIDNIDKEDFESSYMNYLFEYDRYIYRKSKED